ncbi:MAG: arabinogalactan endo-1,4-beta-galactosidase, partial [Firmicutes bacterium]|nr:arabinogalactan endo-1,4-beta-galactosidase [Bacillota bacterium]
MISSVRAEDVETDGLRVVIEYGESGSCSYDDSNNQIIISSPGVYDIYGNGKTSTTIKVTASNGDVHIILVDVEIVSNDVSPLEIDCSSKVTIKLLGTNTLDASIVSGYAGLQKTSTANTLVITSEDGDGKTTGTLNAKGGELAAGIGGGNGGAGSNITISGGTVNATGGIGGAGIGGGNNGAGTVTINGGTVNATGGIGGAGIGGGYYGAGTVTIDGGTVNAYGGSNAAGIGGGKEGDGTVTIEGGAVSATGGTDASDIGGGQNGSSNVSSSEEITYGTIDACSFMRGMDLSSFYSNWTNGTVYYDYEGNEYSESKGNAVDFFKFLYNECGVDWVRLRVWYDPYDKYGNPYGGGNTNVEVAGIIGQWATEAGMTILIDFQYSDFWADADTQLAPKAWADTGFEEKAALLYLYTYESLQTLLDAGVNVGMVQIGNETNGSFCGETDWDNIVKLFEAGSNAVRDVSGEYGMNIKVAFHFAITDDKGTPSDYAKLLDEAGVDYDAIGITYYMYSDGTFANLIDEMNTIYGYYGKQVYIAETAYPYTSDDYDDLDNAITSFDDFASNANIYAISDRGLEAALTAILSTAASTEGCIGMFYWEPAWTALDSSTLGKGTGRATTYSNDYTGVSLSDHEGTAFDNQTLFDENGRPLAALKFYADYVDEGSLTKHSWDEGTVTIAAACTETGVKVYTCSDCGQTKIEIIGATGHTYGSPSFTWSEDYSTCTAVFTCQNDSSHVETETCDVDSETTVATCTEDGKTVYTATCTFNGTTYTGTKTVTNESATGHDWEIHDIEQATCTEDGKITYKCFDCGETKTDTTPATGHDWQVTFTWSGDYSTCTYTFTCRNDSGHDCTGTCGTGRVITKESSCTEDGEAVYIATATLDGTVTNYTDELIVAIAATGHTKGEAVIENSVAATCTTDGSYDEVVYCTVCNAEVSRETVTVPAAGHDYVATTTIDPTCTTGGYTTYTCTVCGHSYTADETDATGHSAGETVIENSVAATCTADGSYDEVVYCTVCGDEISRETVTVPAAGHDYEAVVTAPTCTEGGYTTYTCTVCGDTYTADETAATGHTAGETVIENSVAATCATDGSYDEVVYCTVCNAEVSRTTVTVSKTGHTGGETVIENEVAATCTTDGSYDEVVYCTVCNAEVSR